MSEPYNLGTPPQRSTEFLVARAIAIERYAQVEQSLSMLFSRLLGTQPDVGGIVFFRLTNTTSRNQIIEQLLTKRDGDKYEHYWNGVPNTPNKKGLFTLLRQIDTSRNEIVHWHVAQNVTWVNDVGVATLSLVKPNFWTLTSDSPSITEDDLNAFASKADFVARSINMFSLVASGAYPEQAGELSTWHGIFQQPCIYPPPEGHPLTRKVPAP